MSSHSFWSLSIGEGVMDSLAVTRSYRALEDEKLPIIRVVFSLVSMSLPNKGVGHSGTTRNWWEKYLSIPATKCSSESFSSCFSQNGAVLGGEGSGVGDQDRVGGPCVNQEILGPTCHIQLHPWLQPRDVICDRWAGWSRPLQSS